MLRKTFQPQYAVFLGLNHHNIWDTSHRQIARGSVRGWLLSPEQLATPDQTSIGRRFAGTYDKAWLLIEHPHSYREWNIVGPL